MVVHLERSYERMNCETTGKSDSEQESNNILIKASQIVDLSSGVRAAVSAAPRILN